MLEGFQIVSFSYLGAQLHIWMMNTGGKKAHVWRWDLWGTGQHDASVRRLGRQSWCFQQQIPLSNCWLSAWSFKMQSEKIWDHWIRELEQLTPNFTTPDSRAHPCNPPGSEEFALSKGHRPQVHTRHCLLFVLPCNMLQQLHTVTLERVSKEEFKFRLCPGEFLIFVCCRC